MYRTKTTRKSTTLAIENEPQDDPNNPSVAAAMITDRRRHEKACRAATARNASGRKQLVDSATCEKDCSEAEMELMGAMNLYKHTSGRMFPTWSEVLEVVKGLGYEKVGPDNV